MPLTSEQAREYGKKSSRKGVQNKVDIKVKGYFEELLNNNLERIQEDIDSLTPLQRIECLLKLARFVVPIASTIEISTDNEIRPIILDLGNGISPEQLESLQNES